MYLSKRAMKASCPHCYVDVSNIKPEKVGPGYKMMTCPNCKGAFYPQDALKEIKPDTSERFDMGTPIQHGWFGVWFAGEPLCFAKATDAAEIKRRLVQMFEEQGEKVFKNLGLHVSNHLQEELIMEVEKIFGIENYEEFDDEMANLASRIMDESKRGDKEIDSLMNNPLHKKLRKEFAEKAIEIQKTNDNFEPSAQSVAQGNIPTIENVENAFDDFANGGVPNNRRESVKNFGSISRDLVGGIAKQVAKRVMIRRKGLDPDKLCDDFDISKRAKDGNYVEKREEESGNITYVYDEKHIKERNKKKAEKLNKLSKSLSSMRKQVKKDISSKDDRIRLSAIAVALIDETYERVGNRYSAADMKHYGVTTWLVKHIKFPGNTAKIKYVGKSGIKQDKTVSTPKLVSALKSLCEGKKPSDLVLTIEDLVINDNIVNQYLRPFHITAKDIRGLHANVEVRKQLQGKTPTDEKERKKKFKEAVEEAAKIVGHKPSTLKNQYLVPGFEEKYIAKGQIIGPKNASIKLSKRAHCGHCQEDADDMSLKIGDMVKIKEWDDTEEWLTVIYINENKDLVAIEYTDGEAQTMSLAALKSQIVEFSVPN